jgi:hypothetical protein
MSESIPRTPLSADPDLHALLEEVAAGRLDPDVAVRRLHGDPTPLADPSRPTGPTGPAGSAGPAATTPTEPVSEFQAGVRVVPPPAGQPGDDVTRVVVSVAAGKLVVVGDPTVTTAEAQGPVTATREGSTLRLDNRVVAENAFRFGERDDRSWKRWRHAFPNNETITVRVNPKLPVELSVAAGSAQVTGLRGGLTFRVDAGSLRAFDGAGRLEGRVASGSVQLDWLVRDGASSLRAELGTLKLRLLPGSDVVVSARSDLGSVDLGGETSRGEDGRRRMTVGAGRATLDLDVDLGTAKVQAK